MKYKVRLLLDPHSSMNPWPPGSWSNTLKSPHPHSFQADLFWFLLFFWKSCTATWHKNIFWLFFGFFLQCITITLQAWFVKNWILHLCDLSVNSSIKINEIMKNYWKKTPPQQVENPIKHKKNQRKLLWIVWSFCPGHNYCGLKTAFLIKRKKKDFFLDYYNAIQPIQSEQKRSGNTHSLQLTS